MIPIPSLTTGHDTLPPTAMRRRPVVLLRKDGAPHRHAWGRALQLAAALDAGLVELRLVEPRARRRPRSLDWMLDVRTRWERRFGREFARPPLVTLTATDTEHLVEALGGLDAQLVVLGAMPGWPGDSVVALAAESGTPCVVARCPRPAHPVVACSSLLDPALPVVREAAAVAEALHRPLTVHHHVEPPITQAPQPDLEPRLEALAQARGAEVALTHGADPVTGILTVADAADADVVVVGAARSPAEGSRQVAPRVTALSSHSVMVVPTRG
jgi:nucleotide-binding universal stress UspA family protein